MYIVGINVFPKGKKENTYRMFSSLLEGMERASAKTEIVNLAEFRIRPCTGCLTCLKVTPGKCVIKDDMEDLLKKIADADLVLSIQ